MKIMIFHASAGEGHRRAAIAIQEALLHSGVSTQDLIVTDALDYGSPFFKSSYTGFYYWCVKNIPKMWGVFYDLLDNRFIYNVFYPIRRLYNAAHGQKLLKAVKSFQPGLIICTHFFSAELLGHARKHKDFDAKVVVLVTDFHPVRVWMHDGIDAYWVLSQDAKSTLTDRGVSAEKITVGGFPITSEFQNQQNQLHILEKNKFQANRLTLLLTTGSFGLGEQEHLLNLFEVVKEHVQCFVVCGRNKSLQEVLQKNQYGYPVRVFGFVDNMSELMDASDLMVAKPGGATTAEAMAKRLPMIATGAIPGQETENLKFLLNQNAVFSCETPDQILEVVQSVIKNRGLLEEKSQATDRICNPQAARDIAQMRLKWIQ